MIGRRRSLTRVAYAPGGQLKDLNRTRAYLADIATRHQVPVFKSVLQVCTSFFCASAPCDSPSGTTRPTSPTASRPPPPTFGAQACHYAIQVYQRMTFTDVPAMAFDSDNDNDNDADNDDDDNEVEV